jgi:hypothetical protein
LSWPPAFKINVRPACDDDKGFSCVWFPIEENPSCAYRLLL